MIGTLILTVAVNSMSASQVPENTQIVGEIEISREDKVIKGEQYTFVKSVDENGVITQKIFDKIGEETTITPQGRTLDNRIGTRLKERIAEAKKKNGKSLEKVLIDFKTNFVFEPLEPEKVKLTFDNTGAMEINGKYLSREAVLLHNKSKKEKLSKRAKSYKKYLEKHLKEQMKACQLSDDKAIANAVKQGIPTVLTELSLTGIETFLTEHQDVINAIELYTEPHPDVSETIVQSMEHTALNLYAYTTPTNGKTLTGDRIGIYVMESNYGGTHCPNNALFPSLGNYVSVDEVNCLNELDPNETNLSICDYGEGTEHANVVSKAARYTSPSAFLYCDSSEQIVPVGNLGGIGKPEDYGQNPSFNPVDVDIENYSWNTYNYSNSYTIDDRNLDMHVYDNSISVITPSGNTGDEDGYVNSHYKGYNLVTVGNYDFINDDIHHDSSWKDPETGHSKPEVIAPGTNILVQHNGNMIVRSGTSISSPHVAGFAADLLSNWPGLRRRPIATKAAIMISASRKGGWDQDKVGSGLINYDDLFDATYGGGVADYSNSYLNTSKSYTHHIEAGKYVKANLVWMVNGDYYYDNGVLGQDLDFAVTKRLYIDGISIIQYVASSSSSSNAFEELNFYSGAEDADYIFTVSRASNLDTSNKVTFYYVVSEE